ncbi:restriction endonuclease [Halosimplex amylolyticum]|uniref:restriction endonuclease n=1 Tax=Halosimplex amylolyticum TaxID=3396616 RepID=UPI003F571739
MSASAELVRRTAELDQLNGFEFEIEALTMFCEFFEIDDDTLFREPSLSPHYRPDGMIAGGPDVKPWAVIEVKYSSSERIYEEARKEATVYRNISGATYGIVIGQGYLWVNGPEGEYSLRKAELESDNPDDRSKIEGLLFSPDSLPTASYAISEEANDLEYVAKDHFEMDLNRFERHLAAVDRAESTTEKGETFEEFANFLFGGIPFLNVRSDRLDTKTGEIDLVVEYTGTTEKTIFDEYSRFILVECKNWSKSVGTAQVRNFKGKMDKSQVDIGIIFARRRLSGDNSEYAQRYIHDLFQREGRMILVVGENEIQQLRRGVSFYQILDQAMYRRRFDFE